MACGQCVYWHKVDTIHDVLGAPVDLGQCRRLPPVIDMTSEAKRSLQAVFPLATADTWCGEYRSEYADG
jgi:hypothetical protein